MKAVQVTVSFNCNVPDDFDSKKIEDIFVHISPLDQVVLHSGDGDKIAGATVNEFETVMVEEMEW